MDRQTSDDRTGQVTSSAAEVYEQFFVPALFQEWAARVADAAGVQSGQRVLDVACGTGVLARTLAERVGNAGSVVGLDINDGMLSVARRCSSIAWRQGRAEALGFDDASFDAVVSQFGLMFFEDRRAAIAEMLRVVRPGGRVVVAVWDSLDRSPGYAAVVAILERLFGRECADAVRTPFVLGDTGPLRSLFADAGAGEISIRTVQGTARFPSIRSWMNTEIKGWTLAERLDDSDFTRLMEAAEEGLLPFVRGDGAVAFASPAHIVTVSKPRAS